jgi:flagellar capping protein FliD
MLTGDTNNQQASSLVSKGLALDASIILDSIVSNTGTIKVKETSVIEKVAKYEEQLLKLQDRFENIKARYLKQFAAMETLVQRSKSTGEYLTSQFKAMEGNYSN